jgi:hypothetical protein
MESANPGDRGRSPLRDTQLTHGSLSSIKKDAVRALSGLFKEPMRLAPEISVDLSMIPARKINVGELPS